MSLCCQYESLRQEHWRDDTRICAMSAMPGYTILHFHFIGTVLPLKLLLTFSAKVLYTFNAKFRSISIRNGNKIEPSLACACIMFVLFELNSTRLSGGCSTISSFILAAEKYRATISNIQRLSRHTIGAIEHRALQVLDGFITYSWLSVIHVSI